MLNQDVMKLHHMICDINSPPYRHPQCVCHHYTCWSVWGVQCCARFCCEAAQVKNRSRPATSEWRPTPHSGERQHRGGCQLCHPKLSRLPLLSLPREPLVDFTESVWQFYLLSRCFPGRESGIRVTFCPQQLLIYHRIC